MAEEAHHSKTIDDLRKQVIAKIEEARAGLVHINGIEQMLGLPQTNLSELLAGIGAAPVQSGSGSLQTAGGNGPNPRGFGPVRADEFLGMEPMEAAKQFIRRTGRAVDFDEIADAVQRGGAVTRGSTWRNNLETSLMRSSKGVIKIGEKTYALEEFYSPEQIRNIRQARRASRGDRGDRKKKRKPKGKPTAAKPNPESVKPKGVATKKKSDAAAPGTEEAG